jgi:glycosyltransferase involved in cell wall biosynthesis
MRVAWIVYGSLAQPTGGYIYDRLVIAGLREAGVEVEVVSIEPGDSPSLVHDYVRKTNTELLVGDGLAMRELAPLFECSPVPSVLLIHHLTSWELEIEPSLADRQLEARAIEASDAIVCTSQATRARLKTEFPSRSAEVVVPGADRLPRVARSKHPSDRVRLVVIGSVIPRKRIDWILDALEGTDIELDVIGDFHRDPIHAADVRKRIERLSNVTLCGVLDDASLAKKLSEADALISASSLEGYGMGLAEALHAGVPLIAHRSAALPELIGDESVALLFDDRTDLEHALRRFARDEALRARMQSRARSRSLPSWRSTISSFHAVLRGVSETRARARSSGRER